MIQMTLLNTRKDVVALVLSSEVLIIVVWEEQALRRKGGYDKKENNVYDPKKDVIQIKGELRKYNEFKFSIPFSLHSNSRNLCKWHSCGQNVGFSETVDRLRRAIMKAVDLYEKNCSLDNLLDEAERDDIEVVFSTHHTLQELKECTKDSVLSEFENMPLEDPIKCNGNILLPSPSPSP